MEQRLMENVQSHSPNQQIEVISTKLMEKEKELTD